MAISGITNITYTYQSQDQTLENFINEKFGDYVTATHEVSSAHIYCHIKDKDNHEIIKLHLHEQGGSYTNIYTYNTSGQVSNVQVSGSTAGHWSVYSCSNGLLIRVVNESSSEEENYSQAIQFPRRKPCAKCNQSSQRYSDGRFQFYRRHNSNSFFSDG